MNRIERQAGFSLIEMMISIVVLLLAMAGLASLLIQNSRINKSEQMTVEVQGNARNTLSMVVQKLRSAGWDPNAMGIPTLRLDGTIPGSSAVDTISEIEIFADLDEVIVGTVPEATESDGEQILIRHVNNQIIWRTTADPNDPFVIVSDNISNDSNGDGTIEPMFTPNSVTTPTIVTVQITAQSPVIDPITQDFIRYTVSSDVVLRKDL
jgi:prepilin-type N-terminal cleavage/methylation domain-containing protein